MNRFDFPIALSVQGRRCVVIGGGPEATDKATKLARAGARVQIVAGEIEPALAEQAERGEVAWAARSWAPADLVGAFLVFVTPEERDDAAAEVWGLRGSMGYLACSIDDPERCDFANVAFARAGDVTITISTGGRAPALAKHLRAAIERAFEGETFERFVAELARRRDEAPEGQRGAIGTESIAGLSVELKITYPPWFSPDGAA
jgi:precorrin-2 dehydrogenase/sirohydrochlorin ferrochelatase